MKSAAFLPVALVLANLSGLAISLLVPLLVAADEYSIFALTWSAGQLVASVAYEWMRFGVLRYSVGADEELATTRRSLLWQGYVSVTGILLAGALLAGLAIFISPLALYVAPIAFYAACQGAFEGRQARARALFDNGFYSISWVLRTFISLALSVLAAWMTGSGAAALLGLAASYPITMLVVNRLSALPALRASWNSEQFRFLARYGFFAALATNISMLLPTVLRTLAISTLGLAEAGGLVLAADLSQKAISVVGLAVNIVMMQNSIKAAEFGSDGELQQKARMQIAIATAFVAPAALGFFLIQQPFTGLLVAAEYEATYWQSIGLACLASGVLAFRLFAVDSLFVAFGKTEGAIVGPLLAVASTTAAIGLFAWQGLATPLAITASYAGGTIAGAIAAIHMLTRVKRIKWPTADLLKITAGCLVMLLVWWLLPRDHGAIDLLLITVACGVSYLLISLVLNTANCRDTLQTSVRKVRKRG